MGLVNQEPFADCRDPGTCDAPRNLHREMSIEGYLLDTLALALGFNQSLAESATPLFVSVSIPEFCPSKRREECTLLKM